MENSNYGCMPLQIDEECNLILIKNYEKMIMILKNYTQVRRTLERGCFSK